MIINGVIDAAASQWQEIGDVDRERKVCPYSMSLYCTMEAEGWFESNGEQGYGDTISRVAFPEKRHDS